MTSTIVSWGLTISLVGAVVYVYRPDVFRRLTAQAQETKAVIVEPSSKPASKKPKPKKTATAKLVGEENTGSASETQGGKKRKIVSTPVDKTVGATTSDGKSQQPPLRTEDDGLNDKDFAKQLAQAQSGSKLQVPQKQQTSKKERRASKAAASANPDPSGFSTEASSTTGRDADDDLTPAESPQARPYEGITSKAGDVSDMLEAPAAKPTTLRLTDVSNESKAKKPANKAFEPVLSKKKRNEKQRKEEQKLAREEADRIHEAKKQEQLRTARMAAGTSNQTKANNFAAKANAWQSGTSNAVKSPPPTSEPLLDTFDPAASTAGPAYGAVHTQSTGASDANDLKARTGQNAAAALTAPASREALSASQRQDYASELSEEDQINILKQREQEDAWESVTSKKSKRRNKQETESTSGASSPVRAAPVPAKPQTSSSKVNGNTKKADAVNRFQSFEVKIDSGLQDAEWEA